MEEKEVKKNNKPKKNNSQDLLDKLQKEYDELSDKNLRIVAEMQNIKRRSEEEMMKIRKFEGEDLITKLLEITDDFERALLINGEVSDELKKFLDGFEMIYASLMSILNNKNVHEIDCLNKEFDPNEAQAVLMESKEDVIPGVVIDVLRKGYTYNDKIIRPAMVKVSE